MQELVEKVRTPKNKQPIFEKLLFGSLEPKKTIQRESMGWIIKGFLEFSPKMHPG